MWQGKCTVKDNTRSETHLQLFEESSGGEKQGVMEARCHEEPINMLHTF